MMKRVFAIAIVAVAMLCLNVQQSDAQVIHRGFGPGWGGGSGFSVSVGRGFGPGFVGTGFGSPIYAHSVGWNRGFGVGVVNSPIYRSVPVNTFYRGGFQPGFHSSFYGRSRNFRPGCGW